MYSKVIQLYTHTSLFFFRFFSHIGYYRILSRVPCTIHSVSVGYLFYECVLVVQSCPTLCNTMDCSPAGSSVHGILQARKLEWIPIPFSNFTHTGVYMLIPTS